MDKIARITSGNRVTIPIDIRKEMDLKPGDHIVFEPSENGFSIKAEREAIRDPDEDDK